MDNLTSVAAAVLFSLNFVSPAIAGFENEAAKASDFGRLDLTLPVTSPAPVMAAEPGVIADWFNPFPWSGGLEATGAKAALSENPALYSIVLESLKNKYLRPDTTFTTGKGTKVYVSGAQSSNCPDGGNSCPTRDKFFLVLTTERDEVFFLRGMEIANWGFITGSKTVVIDGEKYVAKIYADISVTGNSKINIKGPKGVVFNKTAQEVGDAMAVKCVDVTLSKAYKLGYGNEVLQGPDGVGFTQKMQVLMIPYPVTDITSYVVLNADEITQSGVSFPSFEPDYGFRLNNGILEIYKLNRDSALFSL